MRLFNSLLLSSLAGLSTIIGGLFVFLPIRKDNINKYISFALSFSVAVMIGISLLDLLPEALNMIFSTYQYYSLFLIIIFLIVGYFLIKLINSFLIKYENNLYRIGILSMISLIIHNFPEGILTFISSYTDLSLGLKISIAIALHNIPEGIAIAVPIYYSTGSYKKALKDTFLSGLSEPIGAILAYIFLARYINDFILAMILVLVSGIMITLAIEKLFPECIKYKENKFTYLGLLIGLIIVILNVLIL